LRRGGSDFFLSLRDLDFFYQQINLLINGSVAKLGSERNFQILSEKNEE